MDNRIPRARALGLAMILLLCAGALHRWVHVTRASQALNHTPLARPLSEIPSSIGQFSLERNVPLESDVLRVSDVDSFLNRAYVDPVSGDRVLLFVGYWGRENVGTGHGPEVCYPAVGWNAEWEPAERIVRFDTAAGTFEAPMMVHRFSRTEPEGIIQRAVGFTAVVGGEFRASSRGVFWHRPSGGRRTGGAYLTHVQVSAPVFGEAWDAGESDVAAFMELLLPQLVRCLPRAAAAVELEGAS
ncbi:MAG: exosortase-associated EpsI family protein [Phycisphaerales bacterium]|nr:MAG: exosortase-associated EpsI family protein [Phycisphaerales bacterium]